MEIGKQITFSKFIAAKESGSIFRCKNERKIESSRICWNGTLIYSRIYICWGALVPYSIQMTTEELPALYGTHLRFIFEYLLWMDSISDRTVHLV